MPLEQYNGNGLRTTNNYNVELLLFRFRESVKFNPHLSAI